MLIINEPYFNESILKSAVITTYNKPPKRMGSFEFTITKIRMGAGFYIEKKIAAIISTLTNYLTVDKITWNYIIRAFRPAYDKKTDEYLFECKKVRHLRLNFGVQSSSNNTWLMIPGVDLVQQTASLRTSNFNNADVFRNVGIVS